MYYIYFVFWKIAVGRISQIFIPAAVNCPFPSLIIPTKFEIYSTNDFFYKAAHFSYSNFYQYSLW